MAVEMNGDYRCAFKHAPIAFDGDGVCPLCSAEIDTHEARLALAAAREENERLRARIETLQSGHLWTADEVKAANAMGEKFRAQFDEDHIEALERVAELEADLASVGRLLEENGCGCEPRAKPLRDRGLAEFDMNDEHDAGCALCLACRIGAALSEPKEAEGD